MGGHSQVVDAAGQVLASAGEGEQVLSVDVDTAATLSWRKAFPVLPDRRLVT
jgi:predicted amidohydrolase